VFYESFVNGGRITANVFSQRLPNLSEQPALARPSIDSRDATTLCTALRRNSRGSGNGKGATRHVPVSISGIGDASRRSVSQLYNPRIKISSGGGIQQQPCARLCPTGLSSLPNWLSAAPIKSRPPSAIAITTRIRRVEARRPCRCQLRIPKNRCRTNRGLARLGDG
jgi:hypothetical protein